MTASVLGMTYGMMLVVFLAVDLLWLGVAGSDCGGGHPLGHDSERPGFRYGIPRRHTAFFDHFLTAARARFRRDWDFMAVRGQATNKDGIYMSFKAMGAISTSRRRMAWRLRLSALKDSRPHPFSSSKQARASWSV